MREKVSCEGAQSGSIDVRLLSVILIDDQDFNTANQEKVRTAV